MITLNAHEIHSIILAIEARKQYIEDDFEAPQEELPHLESALNKFKNISFGIENEIKWHKPKCQICGKPMKNAYDSIEKKISPYLWQTTCKHNKDLRLASI